MKSAIFLKVIFYKEKMLAEKATIKSLNRRWVRSAPKAQLLYILNIWLVCFLEGQEFLIRSLAGFKDRDFLHDLQEGLWTGIPHRIFRRVYGYGFLIRPLGGYMDRDSVYDLQEGLWIRIPHTISRRVYGQGFLIRPLGGFMDRDSIYDLQEGSWIGISYTISRRVYGQGFLI